MPWYKVHGSVHLQGMDIKPRHFGEQTPAMIHVGKCRSCGTCRSHTRGPVWLMGSGRLGETCLRMASSLKHEAKNDNVFLLFHSKT